MNPGKPIYKSRTMQGLLVAVLAFVGSTHIGTDLGPDQVEVLGNAVGSLIENLDKILFALGVSYAGYGRLEAQEPITLPGGKPITKEPKEEEL